MNRVKLLGVFALTLVAIGLIGGAIYFFQQKRVFELRNQCASYRKEVEKRISLSQYPMMEILEIVYSKKLNTCVAVEGYSDPPERVITVEDVLTGIAINGPKIGLKNVWLNNIQTVHQALDAE